MSRPSVLFWVQHLLGIGHLRRAVILARALQADGFTVTLASGGQPLPELDAEEIQLVQLPPARAVDIYFKDIRDADDAPIDDAWRASRATQLVALFEALRPDIVVTELFPFGRRQFRFELLPLLECARDASPRPLIACSVRDILVQPPNEERRVEMLGLRPTLLRPCARAWGSGSCRVRGDLSSHDGDRGSRRLHGLCR